MLKIDIKHHFPYDRELVFSSITGLNNWHEYWPDFIRLQEYGDIKWGNEGARVNVVIRLLNRETELRIKLEEFVKNSFVKYVSNQDGLPDIHHERHFESTPNGCNFRLVMRYEPRRGIKGIFDRYILKRSIIRAIHKTLSNQDRMLSRLEMESKIVRSDGI